MTETNLFRSVFLCHMDYGWRTFRHATSSEFFNSFSPHRF